MNILDTQLAVLGNKFPGVFTKTNSHGATLIVIPGMKLPAGWSHSEGTVYFVAPPGFPAACPESFWLDVPNLMINGFNPYYTNNRNDIPWFPECVRLKWFGWKVQSWNPARDSLFTYAKVCQMRFNVMR